VVPRKATTATTSAVTGADNIGRGVRDTTAPPFDTTDQSGLLIE
jgi:hypothetical protein